MYTTYIVCCVCTKQESVPILRAIGEPPKLPLGWYEIATGGIRNHFCSPECARRWCDDEIERERRRRQRWEADAAALAAVVNETA